MKRLFLLDGMALVYRAHFALIQAPIRNSKGMNTSAVYGFLNTLLSILEKEQPTHLGVAFDTAAPTPRHTLFPAYKAQRDAMPEELATAIPHVKRLCRAFHIPVLEIDGFEADDLIGTLVKRAEADGFESFMVTPDKDFAQLLTPHTFMWKPGRKGNDHEVITPEHLMEIWGVSQPGQIIDLLGLMGDSSDNIPGVPGIGPKTAQKLISEFGSVENLLAHTTALKGRQKELLETHSDQALLSKSLATIITDAPVVVSWEDLKMCPKDDDAVRALLAEFEFRTLSRRLYGDAPSPTEQVSPAAQEEHQDELFPGNPAILRLADVPHHYRLANSPELRDELFAALAAQPSFCFDIETTSLNRFHARLLGVAFCWKSHEAWYLPVSPDSPWLDQLAAALATPTEKIGHNLKYDLAVLLRHGIEVRGPFFDTMLADALLSPERRHSMDYLAETLLNYRPIALNEIAAPPKTPETDLLSSSDAEKFSQDLFATPPTPASEPGPEKTRSVPLSSSGGDFFQDLFAAPVKATHNKSVPLSSPAAAGKVIKELNMIEIPLEKLAEYAAEDADVTWRLAELLRPQLEASGQVRVWHEVEAPLLPVLTRMEMEGISLDPGALAEIGVDLQQQIDTLAASIHQHAGRPFNLASPKQLGEILFDHLGLADKAKKTKTGQYKTDETTLAALEGRHPVITEILTWREASKLKSTYLDALPQHIEPATGRVHTHFHQLIAATGRLASSDPNLQNIPVRSTAGKKIRMAFVPQSTGNPPEFEMLSCDYSQIELRIMAALANDATMIEAFRNGTDVHTVTASKVFVVPPEEVDAAMRRTAKMVNFGIIYGISAFGLSQRLGIPRTEASAIIEAYFREYPTIREFMDQSIATAREKGYAETLCGRRRLLPDLASANQNLRGNAERAAINTPIQGTAADMIKLAMIRVDAMLRNSPHRTRMLLQVHDELVFDLAVDEKPTVVPAILDLMRHALPLPNDVPIEVEAGTGPNWLAAH